jgi:very-short-patch-repair endonuclease
MTAQERLLWGELRDRRLLGFKFRKQMWLTGFIADFACPEARLAVEADGSQHADERGYDKARGAAFARLGWRTLRFWKNEISTDMEAVLTAIRAALLNPSPSRGEGGARSRSEWEGEGTITQVVTPSPRQPSAATPLPCREREK